MLICIYCGYYAETLLDFRHILKDGTYSRKMAKCPHCETIMTKNTLTMDIDVREWARLLYFSLRFYKNKHNPKKDFFHKIKFDDLKKHLKQLGIANQFWDAWKEAKKDAESMNEHIYFLEEILTIQGKAKAKRIQATLINY